MSSGTTRLTVSTGIAKPMPADAPEGEKIAVLTPISRPADVEQRPAGVAGIDRGVGLDHVRDRAAVAGRKAPLSAQMTPVVSVWSSPKGLPMAKTDCPTLRSAEVPTAIGGGGGEPCRGGARRSRSRRRADERRRGRSRRR